METDGGPTASLLRGVFRRLELVEKERGRSDLGEEEHLQIDRAIEILRRMRGEGNGTEVTACSTVAAYLARVDAR